MRGDVVFRVCGVGTCRTDDLYLGTFRTQAEAEIATLSAREIHGENGARHYHDGGFVVREVVVGTDFDPSRPKPRDAWAVRTTEVPTARVCGLRRR